MPPRLKYTALHRAILERRVAQVRLLVEQCGADVNSRDLYGRTPLMLCCALENQRVAMTMARLLLAAEPDLGLKDGLGRTVLAHACLFGREALVAQLASSGVIDPTEPDNDGCTPLHHATVQGNSRIVSLLVEACTQGRSNVDCQNRLGCTPLMLACSLRHYHCALFLLLDGGASGFLKDNAHFLSALEWLRRAELLEPLPPPQPALLRRSETAPLAGPPPPPQHRRPAPPTFITEYSNLEPRGLARGAARGRLARSRTVAGLETARQTPGLRPLQPLQPVPLPLPAAGSCSVGNSRPTTTATSNSRYTSASGDTIYVNVDELSPREARNLLVERLRAQALQFPYPAGPPPQRPQQQQQKSQPLLAGERPTTRDLQALRPPPRCSAVMDACQLLGLYHAAMTAPKPAAVQREWTDVSDLTVGASASDAHPDEVAAAGAQPASGGGGGGKDGGGRRAVGSPTLGHEPPTSATKDKKSVKFKDVSSK